MELYCLDTYALWEILKKNPKYDFILDMPFVVTNWTLIEFYKTMLRELDKETASEVIKHLLPHRQDVDIKILLKAIDYQHDNKKEDLSVFDCVGYIFSLENRFSFVTGDKAFENRKGVLFVRK